MKIGLVLDTSLDPPDGVQQYVVQVGEWLRAHGHDIHYVVGETKRRDLENIHSLARNFKVRFNGNRTTIPLPTPRRKLRNFLREQQFDVLHVQTPHSPFFAQKIIMEADKHTPIVATFHVLPDGWLPVAGNWLLGLWLRPSLKRLDKMLSVSSAAVKFEQQTFHVPSDVSPNVFDYDFFDKAKPLKRLDDCMLNILFLGRLVPRKGCRYLLEAVAQLDRNEVPNFRVVVCGKGPLLPDLKALVAEKGLQDIVEFAGFVSEEEKPSYYAAADIAVFPSTAGESFGIVLLEAMAAARGPVLGGNNPGYASVMEPFPTQLFNPKEPAVLAARLKHYLNDAATRKALAEQQKEYVQRFDVNVVGKQLLKVYTEANNGTRKRQRN